MSPHARPTGLSATAWQRPVFSGVSVSRRSAAKPFTPHGVPREGLQPRQTCRRPSQLPPSCCASPKTLLASERSTSSGATYHSSTASSPANTSRSSPLWGWLSHRSRAKALPQASQDADMPLGPSVRCAEHLAGTSLNWGWSEPQRALHNECCPQNGPHLWLRGFIPR